MLQSWRGLGTLRAGRWYAVRRGARCAGQGVGRGAQDVRWRPRWRRAAGRLGLRSQGCGSVVALIWRPVVASWAARDGSRRSGARRPTIWGLATLALSLGLESVEPIGRSASGEGATGRRFRHERGRRGRIAGTSGFLSRRPQIASIGRSCRLYRCGGWRWSRMGLARIPRQWETRRRALRTAAND